MSIVDLLGEFDKPRVHTYGMPHVSSDGMHKISNLLANRYGVYLPNGFAPLLETSRGKLPKRIQRYMNDYHDVKLPTDVKEAIGNMVEQHALKGNTFIYDFTHEVMSWERGAFGNSGSCWRQSYASSIPMFKAGTEHGAGIALRLFQPRLRSEWYGNALRGYGRCWVLPIAEDRLVMFNPYGERMAVFTSIMLGVLPDGEFKITKVELTNSNSGIYMNNNAGTVVLPVDQITDSSVMLELPRMYTVDCRTCGERFGADSPDAIRLCDKCKGKCDVTGKVVAKEDLMHVRDITVSWRGDELHIVDGYIGLKIQEKLWFCYDCMKWHGDLDKCS